MIDKKKLKELGLNFTISVIALVTALIVGAIIMVCLSINPLDAYGALMKGAFGSVSALTITITKAVPTLFTGLAVALAFKCRVFNIGVEGQFMMGAMFAGIAGIYIPFLPQILHVPVVLLAAMLGGMIWAMFPAIFKQKANVNIVIGTIMFNYIGQYLVQYLILGPLKGKGGASATLPLLDTARLPLISAKPNVLNLGVIIALVAVVFTYILLNKTTTGYEMNAVGMNPNACLSNGINVEKNMFLAMIISGALAGLGGGVEISGTMGKVYNGFSTGYGFSGIPIALMAKNNPFGIIFTSLLMGAMRSGSLMMQSSVGISKNMVDVIQGLIVVFLCADSLIRYYINNMNKRRVTND